ncbi:MAG: hypothetical protein GY786_14735, partial [Proteobacteria bacterium]|nr:hypothetical protein [Pseudomonadota bacterium]
MLSVIVAGCSCNIPTSGEYRFALEVDKNPSAYRNIANAGEDLEISFKLRSLSQKDVCIAPKRNSKNRIGILATVNLIDPDPLISGSESTTRPGLRAGNSLKGEPRSNQTPFLDPHHKAVVRLSEIAPSLLGMEKDSILTGFDLHGNETMFHAAFPVDWSKVDWGTGSDKKAAITKRIGLEVTLNHINEGGTISTFTSTYRFASFVNFIDATRGKRDFV